MNGQINNIMTYKACRTRQNTKPTSGASSRASSRELAYRPTGLTRMAEPLPKLL